MGLLSYFMCRFRKVIKSDGLFDELSDAWWETVALRLGGVVKLHQR